MSPAREPCARSATERAGGDVKGGMMPAERISDRSPSILSRHGRPCATAVRWNVPGILAAIPGGDSTSSWPPLWRPSTSLVRPVTSLVRPVKTRMAGTWPRASGRASPPTSPVLSAPRGAERGLAVRPGLPSPPPMGAERTGEVGGKARTCPSATAPTQNPLSHSIDRICRSNEPDTRGTRPPMTRKKRQCRSRHSTGQAWPCAGHPSRLEPVFVPPWAAGIRAAVTSAEIWPLV
jgi:hypothetical protein